MPSVLQDTIQENIDRCGQHLFGVFSTESDPCVPFVYTVGNALRGLPELLLVGNVNPNTAGAMLNVLGAQQRRLERALSGEISMGGEFPVRIHPCSARAKEEYTVQAGQFLGHEDYEVLQVVLCDREGRFPGDEGMDPRINVELV